MNTEQTRSGFHPKGHSLDHPLPLQCLSGDDSVQTVQDYRKALGQFSTGVAVVTTVFGALPIGMTINSFSSVSLNPGLILWSVAHKSERCEAFKGASHFAVNVLAEDQFDLAMEFARRADRFDSAAWCFGDNALPLAVDALAHFECTMEHVYDGGDHSIIVGRVLGFAKHHGKPLIFSQGQFGSFLHSSQDEKTLNDETRSDAA